MSDPQPEWIDGVPLCREGCPHHDGKRCGLMGFRPDRICEPAVVAMRTELDAARPVLKACAGLKIATDAIGPRHLDGRPQICSSTQALAEAVHAWRKGGAS